MLKDKPTAIDFDYVKSSNNKVEVTFNVVDQEQAIKNGEVVVYDENQQEVLREAIVRESNTIVFDKNSNENFSIEITASYDLDSNALEIDQNEYNNEILLQEEVELSLERKIEMKDILDVTLYEKDPNGKVKYKRIDRVSTIYLNYYPDRYIAKVQMKDMPAFYANVKGRRIEGNKCYL